ncbi:MAG: pyruvate:ferredoxin (flavodoxin) oxidoreductase, partial [Xanthomonadales bacterium]|nr:pyruvate:ferredoxin (flavodoxin) oxidoreductase [Xanthomonadales bacterium]
MTDRKVLDGNSAAAHVAYRVNDVCAIYPITPSSPMAELADQWSAEGRTNIWGDVPQVVEMQSEGGAAGAIHGALQGGALTTTFTASQGLLLMMPNMYKIAGELTPAVFHVAARSLAAQGLSIFGDHQDVMAVRTTGFAQLCSASVQMAHDFALIAQAATLESRVPFIHFFDGFRTSHELNKIEMLSDSQIRSMIDLEQVLAHRRRALNPNHPVIRGTAQNPDVYFQARETVNPFYANLAGIVSDKMAQLEKLTGRGYRLFDYFGAPDAERVIVIMGSGAETARETVEYLNDADDPVGVVRVNLFRPFDGTALLNALPETARSIAVLDRTKEPGAPCDPLHADVLAAIADSPEWQRRAPRVVGGRYGLSSKEFTPAMVKAVLDELDRKAPRNRFTIGIRDDVSGTSLDYDPTFRTESEDVLRAVFYGLGADGTVGANKNSIKILGEDPSREVQAYFVYDSKKSGSRTVSHLRFGPRPIRSAYLVDSAGFVGCHKFDFLSQIDVLGVAAPGATLLLNSPHAADEVWDKLPRKVQEEIIDKDLSVHVIDAGAVAREAGLGGRTNTIMQTCFFALSGVLPKADAIQRIKQSITATYGAKGEEVVARNHAAVDQTLAHLKPVKIPAKAYGKVAMSDPVPAEAPEFVRSVTGLMLAGRGDELPVSALPVDGTWPSGTTRWEKRGIAEFVPEWDPELCIQCGNCVMVCPHAVIRSKLVPESSLAEA